MIVKLYDKNNDPDDLQRIVDVLNDGGILIYPTDTMYAIGCHALKERPIERICRLKKIDPKKNNLSIICYDLSNISAGGECDLQTDETEPAGTVYLYSEGQQPVAENIQEPEGGGHTYSRPSDHTRDLPPAGCTDSDYDASAG